MLPGYGLIRTEEFLAIRASQHGYMLHMKVASKQDGGDKEVPWRWRSFIAPLKSGRFFGRADGMKFGEEREVIFLWKKPGIRGSRRKARHHKGVVMKASPSFSTAPGRDFQFELLRHSIRAKHHARGPPPSPTC